MKQDKNITFYKEEKFKETPIGRVPEDWKVVKVENCIKKVIGGDWGTQVKGKDLIKCRVIRGTDFPDVEHGKLEKLPIRYIKSQKFMKVNLKPNDLLIEISGGSKDQPTGRVLLIKENILKNKDTKLFFTNFVKLIRTKNFVYPSFFYYSWLHKYVKGRTKSYEIRTTNIRNFKYKQFFSNESVFLPPIEEQKAIAFVLSVVDEAIRLTDEIIARTRRLKKGLMQELLTKGIGHKEYKQTEIGKIPKEWEIVRLKEVTLKIKDIDHKMPQKVKKGIPFVSIKYMLKYPDYEFKIEYTDPDIDFISEEDYRYHKRRFNAEKEDIIYSRFGTIGHAKLIQTSEPFIASYSIVLIKPQKRVVYPLFLVYALNSERVRFQARIATKGATNRNLHLGDIKNLKLPLPSLNEQKRIARILLTVDKRLEIEKNKKEKLKRIKKALMEFLFTGKVRIKV